MEYISSKYNKHEINYEIITDIPDLKIKEDDNFHTLYRFIPKSSQNIIQTTNSDTLNYLFKNKIIYDFNNRNNVEIINNLYVTYSIRYIKYEIKKCQDDNRDKFNMLNYFKYEAFTGTTNYTGFFKSKSNIYHDDFRTGTNIYDRKDNTDRRIFISEYFLNKSVIDENINLGSNVDLAVSHIIYSNNKEKNRGYYYECPEDERQKYKEYYPADESSSKYDANCRIVSSISQCPDKILLIEPHVSNVDEIDIIGTKSTNNNLIDGIIIDSITFKSSFPHDENKYNYDLGCRLLLDLFNLYGYDNTLEKLNVKLPFNDLTFKYETNVPIIYIYRGDIKDIKESLEDNNLNSIENIELLSNSKHKIFANTHNNVEKCIQLLRNTNIINPPFYILRIDKPIHTINKPLPVRKTTSKKIIE